MKRAAAALVGMLLLGGCLFGPAVECDDGRWEEGLTCEGVLAAARAQLAGTAGITKLTASEGLHCPSAPASCPFTPFVITVYADLVDGSQLFVTVGLEDDGRLRAQAPKPVEPEP